MKPIFLYNANNLLGKKILENFDANTKFSASKLKNENIFIFNTTFDTEDISEHGINKILDKLNKTFETVQKIVNILIESDKKGKFIFFTTNSNLQNLVDFPFAPIYDEAIHAFMKSLTKELNPFNLTFNTICLEPISEMLEKNQKKEYRKQTKNIATKKIPTKLEDLMILLQEIINSKTSLLSGTKFSVGEGVFV